MNKKILLSLISYFYLFYFFILFLSGFGGGFIFDEVLPGDGNPIRFFTVYFETKLDYDVVSYNSWEKQNNYLNYGIGRQPIIQIILPIIIIYISFFTKLNILERKFTKNYMLWFYIITFILLGIMYNLEYPLH